MNTNNYILKQLESDPKAYYSVLEGELGANIATNIRKARAALNLTIDDLSEMSGLSIRTLRGYESGTANPNIRDISRVAIALGIRPQEIFYSNSTSPWYNSFVTHNIEDFFVT
jgi:transcriptional regulator with XRE-family HTH domain